MGCFEKKQVEIPNHIRIITGKDWETKSNDAIEEEFVKDYFLCDIQSSIIPSDYGFDGVLILLFEKGFEEVIRRDDNKNTNATKQTNDNYFN